VTELVAAVRRIKAPRLRDLFREDKISTTSTKQAFLPADGILVYLNSRQDVQACPQPALYGCLPIQQGTIVSTVQSFFPLISLRSIHHRDWRVLHSRREH
jgi:hypothetical protein